MEVAYAVTYAFGVIVGIAVALIFLMPKKVGVLIADESDPEVDRYSLILNVDFEDLKKERKVIFLVDKK